jgi:serine/threonine protein kinase
LQSINQDHIWKIIKAINSVDLFSDRNMIDGECHGIYYNDNINNNIINNNIIPNSRILNSFMPNNCYSILNKNIGHGACGHIQLYSSKKMKYYYAVKKTRQFRHDRILITHNIDHPYIIKCFMEKKGIISSKYILEYGYPIIDKYFDHKYTAKMVIAQLISALTYLQNRFIIHGDIYQKNIIIGRDSNIKICDFGISRAYNNEEEYKLDLLKKKVQWYHNDCENFAKIIKPLNKSWFDDKFLSIINSEYYKFSELIC